MNSIGNISGSSSLSYLQPVANVAQAVGGGDSDGDSDGSSGAGKIGRSNFMNAIGQALGQTLSGSSATSAPASAADATSSASSGQDPQAALQGFLQSLFAALHQAGQGAGATATNGDSDRDESSSSVPGVGGRERGSSNLTSGIQDLLKQLSSNNQSAPTTDSGGGTDALGNLSSKFQNLIDILNGSQGQQASTGHSSALLQSFLQNMLQNLNGGQNISGAMLSTQA